MNLITKIAAIGAVLILNGCGGMQASKNTEAMRQLRVGQSEEMVISFMGRPNRTQAIGGRQYWLYRTTGFASQDYDLFTPILFVNGKVEGWGKQYFKEIGIAPEAKTQSTSGGVLVVPGNLNNQPNMTPFMTNPSSATVRGNTQPFQQSQPQPPIQNPSINCMPNGLGGVKCQ